MSKRRFMDSDEDYESMNPYPKRIRNCDGQNETQPTPTTQHTQSALSVNPRRYDANYVEKMSDNDECDGKEKDDNMETDDGIDFSSLENGASFDTLLYQLANMNVGSSSDPSNEGMESIETCPICVARMPLSQFAKHVYECLDGMEDGDRQDLRSQVERDEDLAMRLVENEPYRYSDDMSWQCPICNKILSVGMSINVHANECLDAQEADEASSAMGKFSIASSSGGEKEGNGGGSGGQPKKGLTSEQMSACASALLSNPKGTVEYESMLSMFETLGFNETNIRRVVNAQQNGQGNDMQQDEQKGNVPPPPSPFVGVMGMGMDGDDDRMDDGLDGISDSEI